LLANHHFDSNNVGGHLGNLGGKLYRLALFARPRLRLANKKYRHFTLQNCALESRGERSRSKHNLLLWNVSPVTGRKPRATQVIDKVINLAKSF
jgi:hypothetical protein